MTPDPRLRSLGPAMRALPVALGLLALTAAGPTQAQATSGLLSRVQVVAGAANTCPALFVSFNTRVRLTGQQSDDGGRTLMVRFSLDAGESDTPAEDLIETYPNLDVPGLGPVQVSLDASGSAPVLRLRFERPVEASVAQGGESSVVVTGVHGAGAACGGAAPAATASTAAPAATGAEADVAEARTLITAGDYPRAIQLLTRVLSGPESDLSPDAQEMLGIARERNGQLAHAKAEYETYLERYPNAPGAARVRQRLAALTAAQARPRTATASPGQPPSAAGPTTALPSLPPARTRPARASAPPAEPARPAEPTIRGRLSSFYLRNQGSTLFTEFETDTSDEDQQVYQDSLVTTLDVEGTSETRTLKRSWRLAGDYDADFTEGGENTLSVSRAYVDFEGKNRGAGLRIGRQTRNDGGVFGRFDGIEARLPFGGSTTLRTVLGAPANSSSDPVYESEKLMAGVSLTFEDMVPGLDAGLYAIGQTRENFTDRQAVGMEMQYQSKRSSVVGLVDYDTYFQTLNLARLSATWLGQSGSSFTFTADYNHSPLLTVGNALTGQTATTLTELSASYTDEELKQLALDRTPTTSSVTLAFSRPMSERWQMSLDATAFQTGETPASGGVEATPATGPEYFGSVQFVGSNVFSRGDTVSLSLRYADAETSDLLLFDTYVRFDATKKLRLKPRVRLGYRLLADGAEETFAIPSLNMTFKLDKKTEFEVEAGGRISSTDAPSYSEESNEAYVNAGFTRQF